MAGESKLVYNWSVTSSPAGGTADLQPQRQQCAKNAMVTFTKAGTYNLAVKIVDGGGLSVTAVKIRRGDAHAHKHKESFDCLVFRFRDKPATARSDVRRPVRQRITRADRPDVVDVESSLRGPGAELHDQRRRDHGHLRDGRLLHADRPRCQRSERFVRHPWWS